MVLRSARARSPRPQSPLATGKQCKGWWSKGSVSGTKGMWGNVGSHSNPKYGRLSHREQMQGLATAILVVPWCVVLFESRSMYEELCAFQLADWLATGKHADWEIWGHYDIDKEEEDVAKRKPPQHNEIAKAKVRTRELNGRTLSLASMQPSLPLRWNHTVPPFACPHASTALAR